MNIKEMTRVFRFGSVSLPDPDPSLEVEKVRELYSVNYPHLAAATVNGPTIEGTKAVYLFEPAPVKTKG